jgi:hypothetical protein
MARLGYMPYFLNAMVLKIAIMSSRQPPDEVIKENAPQATPLLGLIHPAMWPEAIQCAG